MGFQRLGPLRIGNYILGETLGVGSFGKVKLASHQQTEHKVAVKILNRKKIRILDMIGKIKREIQNLKLFSHPHIIKLYEVITTPTDIFMVMEYVSGGELFDHIVKHGKFSEDVARSFFQQIISAVEYCHRHKIVHRDLKPENLLLDKNKNVKVADFGLSNIMMDGEFLKTSCGSPNYAAPEVISGKLYAGPEVDVWSCGVILYALLCGKLPFDDEYIPSLFKKIKKGIFVMPSYLSDAAQEILTSMLQVDPLKRATIAQIREHPWFNVDLPEYLKPHVDHNDSSRVDEEVLQVVCSKMSATAAEVSEALRSNIDNDPLKIAYNLVLDDKVMRMRARESKDLKGKITDPEVELMITRSIQRENAPGPLEVLPSVSTSMTAPGNQEKRPRWHLGIRSKSKPHEIMSEVFRAMKTVDFEWKILSPFHVYCRSRKPKEQIKLSLQLYKIDDQYYLLDFKNLTLPPLINSTSELPEPSDNIRPDYGHSYENVGVITLQFFEQCALLIRELAVSRS